MTEQEFEQYVRGIGFYNVSMDEEIYISHGLDIILEYLQDKNITGIVKLIDIYRQILKIQEVLE